MANFFTRTRLSAIVLLAALMVAGFGCGGSLAAVPSDAKPLTLEVWGVLDDQDAYDSIINAYHTLHPNVTINYHKYRMDEYENAILNALAEDRGPDIFAIHNTWTRNYVPKLLPMPAQIKMAFKEVQGTVQKQSVWVDRTRAGMTTGQLKSAFVDQVAEDAIIDAPTGNGNTIAPQIFGLPMAMDTMALYYNKDVLNAAGIPTPAQNWGEFQDHVKRITKYDSQGKLVQPAAGIGTSKNVDRAFDLLSILMMQNGAQMTDDNGFPFFNKVPAGMNRETPPAAEALTFYTDFANPSKEVFTWDDTQPNSFDAFIAGKTAYFFGYSYHLPMIRAQAPKLNFGIAPLPQIDPNVKRNYANYWLEAVSKKTKQPNAAWDFIQFATGQDQVKSYLSKTAKPTALRALITTQLNDNDLATFASQTLTAKSWYKGTNIQATEQAFADMIDAVLAGTDPQKALNLAADTVAQTVR